MFGWEPSKHRRSGVSNRSGLEGHGAIRAPISKWFFTRRLEDCVWLSGLVDRKPKDIKYPVAIKERQSTLAYRESDLHKKCFKHR